MTSIDQLKKAQWGDVEHEFVSKFRALRDIVKHLKNDDQYHQELADQAIMPLLELVGDFCMRVRIHGDEVFVLCNRTESPKDQSGGRIL